MITSLDIVIVTYNRIEQLKKTLECYANQTMGFRNLIIVDNCSTDGTSEYLDEWCAEHSHQEKFCPLLIHSAENVGGSGGFYLGQKKAMELNADWVFVADDDAYAAPDMVEKFFEFITSHDTSKLSAICAKVLNINGSICLYHRDYHVIEDGEYKRIHSVESDYEKEYFSIDDLSYVGSFLNACALKKVGLVNPDYFIYYDDSEHSIRLKKWGDIVVVPNIVITHDGGAESTPDDVMLSWRQYYFMRNTTYMFLHHYPSVGLRIVYKQFRDDFHAFRTMTKRSDYAKFVSSAIWSAFFGRLGKHNIYKPGWCLKRKK